MIEYVVNFLSNDINDFVLHERIVRCRDCKYYGCSSEYYGFGCTKFQFGSWNRESLADGYCAWGERK